MSFKLQQFQCKMRESCVAHEHCQNHVLGYGVSCVIFVTLEFYLEFEQSKAGMRSRFFLGVAVFSHELLDLLHQFLGAFSLCLVGLKNLKIPMFFFINVSGRYAIACF